MESHNDYYKVVRWGDCVKEHMITYKDIADDEIDLYLREADYYDYDSNVINVTSFQGLYRRIVDKYNYIFIDVCGNRNMDCPCYAEDYVGLYPTYVIVESGISSKFNTINSTVHTIGYGTKDHLENGKWVSTPYEYDEPRYDEYKMRQYTCECINELYLYQTEHGLVCVFDSSKGNNLRKVNKLMCKLSGRFCLLTNSNIRDDYGHFNGDVYHRDSSSDVVEFKGSGMSRTTEGTPAERDLGKVIFDVDLLFPNKRDGRWTLAWRNERNIEEMNLDRVYGLTTIRHFFWLNTGNYSESFRCRIPNSVVDTREAFYDNNESCWVDATIYYKGNCREVGPSYIDYEGLFKLTGQRLQEYTAEDGTSYKSWEKCVERFTEGQDVIEIDVLKLLDKYKDMSKEYAASLLSGIVEQCINGYSSPSCDFREPPKRIYLSDTRAIVITHYSDSGD